MTRQYYFKQNLCRALSARDADCICWHDEGTGVYAATPPPHLQWRDKPAAPTDEKTTTPIDDGTGQSAGFEIVSPDDLQAALETSSQSWARGEMALARKPVGPAPSTHVRAVVEAAERLANSADDMGRAANMGTCDEAIEQVREAIAAYRANGGDS